MRTRPACASATTLLLLALPACGDGGGGDSTGPPPPDPAGTYSVVGRGEVTSRHTSDLWVVGDVAYTGTWGFRTLPGNTLNVWDVSDPAAPALVDSVQVDARTTNDVKVSPDGTLGVVTHESSLDGQNGITLLDLADPLHPEVIVRYTTGLESGVHNVWLDGDHLYVTKDPPDSRLVILDVSDPANPVLVGTFDEPTSFLHDVYVRDGLAFLSWWDAGLIVLDVGNGIRGGSPAAPVEVSRIRTQGGQTHNAWYWPVGGYVFVGEEDFGTPGILHVVDVSDLESPVEVATFAPSGATDPPHNVWLDETAEILHVAWYGEGIFALDVSGTLAGDLSDRVMGSAVPFGGTTYLWAPQVHDGLVFASDLNNGLVVLRPEL